MRGTAPGLDAVTRLLAGRVGALADAKQLAAAHDEVGRLTSHQKYGARFTADW